MMEELNRRLSQGEITGDVYQQEKGKLEEIMSAASFLQSQMSGKELADTVMEFMDAKDKLWQKELDFQNMYVYYHIKGICEGKQLIPPKQGWYGLRVVVDYLDRRGLIRTTESGKILGLTGQSLGTLLEYLLERTKRNGEIKDFTGYGKTQLNDRSSGVRDYTVGDAFRDISIRHTMKEIAKKKTKLTEINRDDFKVFVRQPRKAKSDIAFCVDSSGSMGFRRKLIYARLVAAGMARAALEKGDRVSLVTFDDLGKSSPSLTSNKEEIFNYIININAGGNTNIGDGIKCATKLLFHKPSRNQKWIVLITDGEPSAISRKAFRQFSTTKGKDISEESAIFETRKASSKGIKTSVIYIADGEEVGKEFVRNIAKAGMGQVRTISTVDDIGLWFNKYKEEEFS